MGKATKKNERLSGEERRKQIINVALTLFAEKGFSGTRTREIAELADVSETLIFQHFKTKEDLYRAALTELFSLYPVPPEVEEKMAEKDDVGVFRTFALHVIKHGLQDRRIVRLGIFSALEGPPFGEIFHHGGEAGPPFTRGRGQERCPIADVSGLAGGNGGDGGTLFRGGGCRAGHVGRSAPGSHRVAFQLAAERGWRHRWDSPGAGRAQGLSPYHSNGLRGNLEGRLEVINQC